MVKLCLVALHRSDIDDIKRMHRSREAGRQLWLSLILGDDMAVVAMAGGLDRGTRGVESRTTCWCLVLKGKGGFDNIMNYEFVVKEEPHIHIPQPPTTMVTAEILG